MTEGIHCSCSSYSNWHRGGFRIGGVNSIYTRRYTWELVLEGAGHRQDYLPQSEPLQEKCLPAKEHFRIAKVRETSKFISCLLTKSHGNVDVERSPLIIIMCW
jgi:hypothetical protein